VVVAFRKKALLSVNLWDTDMITEDISVSWKLQEKFWDIRYEPKALCWMLVPETISGIWKQRIRWAQGGQEVLMRHSNIMLSWKHRRLWPIYLEQFLSILWSFSWIFVTVFYLIFANTWFDRLIWMTFASFFLVLLSMIQLRVSLDIDAQYDDVRSLFFFGAWYPFIYWLLNALIVLFAFPKAIRSRLQGGDALWTSPDRGFRK
jgi:biofilm PGA synthesis N-glycosyltransferase PgaC